MASEAAGPLSIEEIEAIIPHRYPFLLVDRVLEVTNTKVKALKNVTGNEPFFQGHFPGFKIMPGVLIIEAMAQAAAVMQLRQPEREGWYVLFAGIDKARFKRPVRPGDTLIIEAELTKMRGPIGMGRGTATVDGDVAATCEIMFALQPPAGENAK